MVLTGCSQEKDPRSEEQRAADFGLASEVRELTGGPTRLVWIQDMGQGTDFLAQGTELRMMALDSDDGRGKRVLLDGPRNMAKPMFTANGEWIVFSDRDNHRVHALRWDGARLLDLGPGFGLTSWVDPETGIEWLYVAREQVDKHRTLASYESLWRYPLFRSARASRPQQYSKRTRSREELVWNQTKVSEDSFQISMDGRYASTAFPWPHMGILDRETGLWNRLGQGCWGAMSPDNDHLFWIFDGPHRNVSMFRVGTDENWTVNVNSAPGMDGYEVYHPRWSNHPRIIAVTGPYKVGEGSNKIHGGGNEVKVYLGRLNQERTEVEAWVMVTDDKLPDFYPDVWVQGGLVEKMADQEVQQTKEPVAFASRWPANPEGLVYIWENAAGKHEVVDPQSRSQFIFRPEPRHLARYDRNHAMLLDGGFFIDDTAGSHLTRHAPMDSFALEFVATQSMVQPFDESWFFSVITATGPELTIASSHGTWKMQSRDMEINLGPADAEQPAHIALSYSAGKLHAFINSELVVSETVALDPNSWGDAAFLFGGNSNGNFDWQGSLENFAFYDRSLGKEEIIVNHQLVETKLSQRDVPNRVLVRASVSQASAVPAPKDIAPYQRGLVVNEYEVIEVLKGKLNADQFLAAHWAILDETILDTAYRIPGSEHVMLLERFDERKELEGERLAQEIDNFFLELYFDLYL
ncbi:LamG-like jellyroll fold domain-containing protein [Desulfonatronum parangueonense]